MKTTYLVSIALLTFIGCKSGVEPAPDTEAVAMKSSAEPKPEAHASSPGKPSAPVTISSEVSGSEITIGVAFTQAAEDISINIRPIDGAKIEDGAVGLTLKDVSVGHRLERRVSLADGAPQGSIVVTVTAIVSGKERATTKSIRVGPQPEPPKGHELVDSPLGPILSPGTDTSK